VLTLTKIALESPATEFPRGLAVKVSTDGTNWQEPDT
jgi:hypothetical protein